MPLVPELYVSDINKSLDFYVNTLGFSIEWHRPEKGFAAIGIEDVRLMLEQYASVEEASQEEIKDGHWRMAKLEYPLGRGINFEIMLTKIEPLYAKLKSINYPIALNIQKKQYRVDQQYISVQQFLVIDPDGYLLRFQEELGWTPLEDKQQTS